MDRRTTAQEVMILSTLEQLVPQDHFLRKLEAALNLSFVYERVAHLYSECGRRSIDPVILIKMLLLGYFYGIESERKLEREIQVNIAFRWYLGLNFED
ncbi:transposase [Eubacteriales bacterium OttesenSCG-928-N13]|nr:transposase [Eubacteriales bacterium OttesenSCG-928-N13]